MIQILAPLAALAVSVFMLELLRRRQLREKYAVLWLLVTLAVLGLGIWPGALDVAADLLGIADPPNLLAFVALLLLLAVAAHLSWEVSRLEERTRILAEEVALQRHELERRDEQR